MESVRFCYTNCGLWCLLRVWPLGFPGDDTVLEQSRLEGTTGHHAHVLLRMFHSLHYVRRTSYVRVLPECDGNTGTKFQTKNRIALKEFCVSWNFFMCFTFRLWLYILQRHVGSIVRTIY